MRLSLSGNAALFVAAALSLAVGSVWAADDLQDKAPASEQTSLTQAPSIDPKELAYAQFPLEADIPVPPDGWYSVEINGEKVDVFRDVYGVPHVFAPSQEAAFGAQGYVLAEDRILQLLETRAAVRGRSALQGRSLIYEGKERIENDREVITRGYRDDEMQAMVDALSEEMQRFFYAYIDGINLYLKRFPGMDPVNPLDLVAGTVFHMTHYGGWGGDQLDIYQLANTLRVFKGDEFVRNFMNDFLPADVPCAPTTDHSDTRHPTPPPAQHVSAAFPFDPGPMVAILEREATLKARDDRDGLITTWGSFTWVVAPQRTVSGHAMLFAAPMLRFRAPARGASIHLVAPGLNVSGMCFLGSPGVQVGHNERIAWGTTSALITVKDIFEEKLNPEDRHQYWHNDQWKDMETYESPIPFKEKDGPYGLEPVTVCRTVHGPVIYWHEHKDAAYSLCMPWRGTELASFMAFIDLNRAKNLDDVEAVARTITTSMNVCAADVDGNIGYWLTGRLPKRKPQQDYRVPNPGTGEYDWDGVMNATDLVHEVNPPEGWFANWNSKPSVKTPSWFPEGVWGVKIFEMLAANDRLGWYSFAEINRVNAHYSFLAWYMKPYLLDLLKARTAEHPDLEPAIELLEAWPNQDVPEEPAALLFNEWIMETMIDLFSPDFGPLVQRNIKMENLRLFFTVAFRILLPEKSGIVMCGDYLHGRDKDDLAFEAFMDVFARLKEEHGEDISQWRYEPPDKARFGSLGQMPMPNVGTYWMIAELSDPIVAEDMLVPGQSALKASPHYGDQFDLFCKMRYKKMKHMPADFGR